MRWTVLGVCVLVAAISAVGCGSSGSGSGSSAGTSAESTTAGTEANASDEGRAGAEGESKSGPLSKKAFMKEAEAVCQKIPTTFEEKSEALAKSLKNGQSPTPAEAKLKAGVPTDNLAIEELEALSPPTGDEQEVDAIIQSLEKAVKGLEENPESEFTGPSSPFAEWQKLTKEYGLSFCSQL